MAWVKTVYQWIIPIKLLTGYLLPSMYSSHFHLTSIFNANWQHLTPIRRSSFFRWYEPPSGELLLFSGSEIVVYTPNFFFFLKVFEKILLFLNISGVVNGLTLIRLGIYWLCYMTDWGGGRYRPPPLRSRPSVAWSRWNFARRISPGRNLHDCVVRFFKIMYW